MRTRALTVMETLLRKHTRGQIVKAWSKCWLPTVILVLILNAHFLLDRRT